MTLKHCCALGLALPWILSGIEPEAFSVMSMGENGKWGAPAIIQEEDYFPNLGREYKKGRSFIVAPWDYNLRRFHPAAANASPFPEEAVNAFSSKGEYVMKIFVLRTYAELSSLNFETGDLRSDNGKIIGSSNLKVMRIAASELYPQKNFMIFPGAKNIPANALIRFAVFLHAPPDAVPGIYRGKLKISGGSEILSMNVNFRVLNLRLPESDAAFGCYMPFYAKDQHPTQGKWAGPDYTMRRQDGYFRFQKTRSFNSPTFFHVACEFPPDGREKLKLSFETQDRLINLLKRNHIDKSIVFDLRYLIGISKELAKMEVHKKAGLDDLKIYRELASEFIEHAEKSNYPRFFVLAEEEIANGGVKLANYNRYGKILQEVAGKDHALMLDNSIGYGFANAVDRGAADGYAYRQYNSWEQSALDLAGKQSAEVWSYNYGFSRPAFGLIQHRLNSHAHHQWAEQWEKTWSNSIPCDNGTVTSLPLECAHEGITDYRYLQALAQKDFPLARRLVSDIPPEGGAARSFASNFPQRENDLLRWIAALSLAGESDSGRTAPGESILLSTYAKQSADVQDALLVIRAGEIADSHTIDGTVKGSHCLEKNGTGPLRYMVSKERSLKARSSSEEEFRKWNSPSYSGAWVNYNNKGLILTVSVNHTPFNLAMCGDDDMDMWRDNCMEFFFRTPDGTFYQLIVNSASKRTFSKNGIVLKNVPIQVASVPRKGDAGGYTQEIFLPWSVFGLTEKPDESVTWAFNAAREFHSWNQLTSWARVEGSFHENARWGALRFSGGRRLQHFKELGVKRLFPGNNVVSGKIGPLPGATIRFVSASGKVVSESGADAKTGAFSVKGFLPLVKMPEMYRLEIFLNGKVLEEAPLPLASGETPLTHNVRNLRCASGDVVSWIAEVNLAPGDLKKETVRYRLRDSQGRPVKEFNVDFTKNRSLELWLKTDGIAPGNYTLVPVISGAMAEIFPKTDSLALEVFPAFF